MGGTRPTTALFVKVGILIGAIASLVAADSLTMGFGTLSIKTIPRDTRIEIPRLRFVDSIRADNLVYIDTVPAGSIEVHFIVDHILTRCTYQIGAGDTLSVMANLLRGYCNEPINVSAASLEGALAISDSEIIATYPTQLDSTWPGPSDFIIVESLPEMIAESSPGYPAYSTQHNEQGAVWIKAAVDELGTVRSAIIAKSSGYPRLDQAALAVAPKNRFKPATQNGKAVRCWVSYRVVFKITE